MSAKGKSGLGTQNERKMNDYAKSLVQQNSAVEIGAIINDRGEIVDNLGSNQEVHITFTDDQFKKAEGNTVVHWHPEDMTISYGDAYGAAVANMREIRAITSKGTYSFRWNNQMSRSEADRLRAIFKDEHDKLKEKAQRMRDALYPMSHLKDPDGRAKPSFRNPDGTVNRPKVEKWLNDRKESLGSIYNGLVEGWYRDNQKKYGFTYSSRRWK